MAETGIYKFAEELGLNSGTLNLYYNFRQSAGSAIESIAPANSIFSGELSSVGDFYNYSGSGFFTGQTIQIKNTTGLSSDNWSILFVAEKSGTGSNAIFSNYQTGDFFGETGYSGFVIGINSSNRLFFEFNDGFEPICLTLNSNNADKNIFCVHQSNGIVSLEKFNFETESLEGESYYINTFSNLNIDQNWYIGGQENYSNSTKYNSFTGWLDGFIYCSEDLLSDSLSYLSQGFYKNISNGIELVDAFSVDEITGFEGVDIIETGITGRSITQSGTITDVWGNEFPFFIFQDLTGFISGGSSGLLSGNINYSVTGLQQGAISTNYSYMLDFGFQNIALLREYDEEDSLFTYVIRSGASGESFNEILNYDNASGTFKITGAYNTNNSSCLYLNGVAQMPSGFTFTGSGYNRTEYPLADYYLTGNNGYVILATGSDTKDSCFIDIVTGSKKIIKDFSHSGGSNTTLGSNDIDISGILFFNGIHLKPTRDIVPLLNGSADYLQTPTQVLFPSYLPLFSGGTGDLISFPITSGQYTNTLFIDGTDSIQNMFADYLPDSDFRFLHRNCLVFFNRQRQLLDVNYIERSKYGLLGGSGQFKQGNQNLYSDTEDFFEE